MRWLGSVLLRRAKGLRIYNLICPFLQVPQLESVKARRMNQSGNGTVKCPSCGMPITAGVTNGLSWSHNVETCRLVNLALAEMRVSFDQVIRVNVYEHSGPLRGYYHQADPYTIHVSDYARSLFPEYIIFHEIKHLVDCLTKGWSEEGTPDPFARSLCAKYGFIVPPPHQHYNPLPTAYD